MKALGRGCLELLVVWALVGYGLHLVLEERFTPPGPFYGALIGGMLVASGWGLFRNAWQARGQMGLIRRALRGDWPYDGSAYAAVGPAVALNEPLLTPFQRIPCVLYSYELVKNERVRVRGSKGSRTENRRTVYMTGQAMTQWAVRTRAGDIKVIGFPIPDQFPEETISAEDRATDLRQFNEQQTFTEIGKWEVGKLISFAQNIMAEDDGQMRQDVRFEEAQYAFGTPGGLKGCMIVEQYIPVDETITVIGCYDSQKSGLVNLLSQGGLQAIPGDGQEAIGLLRGRWRSYSFFALVLMLLGSLGSYGLLTLRENSEPLRQERDQQRTEELLAAMEAEDLEGMRTALRRGGSADALDKQQHRPVLQRVTTREMFDVLREHGANLEILDSMGRPPLLAAIDQGQLELAGWLLEAGVDVNRGQVDWGRKPLEVAYERGYQELAEQLIQHGATGVFVTRQLGEPLTGEAAAEFAAILARYGQGLNDADVNAVRSVTDSWPQDYFDSVQRGLYAQTRPTAYRIDAGYIDGDAATVIATGPSRRGIPERYVVTFVRRDDGWRIRRDHFDERMDFTF